MGLVAIFWTLLAGSVLAGPFDVKPESDARALWERDAAALREAVPSRPPWTRRVRFPTLETFALRSQKALAGAERGLTKAEAALAKTVFGDSLDLSRVRIVHSSQQGETILTLGDFIRLPNRAPLTDNNLIHELAHVWRFQTQGADYISDAFAQQIALSLSGEKPLIASLKRYPYKLIEGKSLLDYTAEEQAQIVEDCVFREELMGDARCAVVLARLRASRPMPARLAEEMIAGPRRAAPKPSVPNWPAWWGEDPPPPQLEVRF